MHKRSALAALFATTQITLSFAAAAASGVGPLSGLSGAGGPGPEGAVIFAGGMSGGGAGMSGGAGMGGGNAGGMGGGHFGFGGPFGSPSQSFGQPAEDQPGNGEPSSYYTYQCITPAGRCPFVAPASLRTNSLRSGADCVCADGRSKGRIE
jgi:hypothetical protein